MSKWNLDSISAEILRRYDAHLDLSYSAMTREDLPLLRAATRYLGSWEAAITHSGLDYSEIRRYRSWTNEKIIERIRELYADGKDLSWRYVSLTLDPGLAAAATKKSHFGSWRAALEASGIDYDTVRRYRDWSHEEVLRRVRGMYAEGKSLNAKSLEQQDITLITAARRRFPSWHRTLVAAGLDYREIVLRAPFQRRRTVNNDVPAERKRSGQRQRIARAG
jgi:hypothetical protein